MNRKRIISCIVVCLFYYGLTAQISRQKIGDNAGKLNPSAVLEIESKNKGFLPPRMSTAQLNAIANPAEGLMVYDTSRKCIRIYQSGSWSGCLNPSAASSVTGITGNLDCENVVHNGGSISETSTLPTGIYTTTIPYTGGDGSSFPSMTIASTGVIGLTASISGTNFDIGPGSLTFKIEGTPSRRGMAYFEVNIGNQGCTFTRSVDCKAIITIINKNSNATGASHKAPFLCYNLGADTTLDPFDATKSDYVKNLIGDYYQWGVNKPVANGVTTSPNAINGWNATPTLDVGNTNGEWANTPCPKGYRLPTNYEWDNIQNITFAKTLMDVKDVGNTTWTISSTTFNSMKYIVSPTDAQDIWMSFPIGGNRSSADGLLSNNNYLGYFHSSTYNVTNGYYYMRARQGNTPGIQAQPTLGNAGMNLRCIYDFVYN